MEKELAELIKWLEDVESFSLPTYNELPNIELYMEQVLQYINGELGVLSFEDKKTLTSFMVNNYVKAKMIDEPIKKKYSKEQIGYLMAICLMKQTISMSDMSLLLEMDHNVSTDKGRIYGFFTSQESSIIKNVNSKAKARVENYAKLYEKKLETLSQDEADNDVRNFLGLLALRMAITAQANKLISDRIIQAIRADFESREPREDADKLDKREKNISVSEESEEAHKLAKSKHKAAKKAKKADKKSKKELEEK